MGLSEAEEHEYAELCERERILMRAPAVIDVTGRVIDLDAERQRQDH
jgi:hypothetical protein